MRPLAARTTCTSNDVIQARVLSVSRQDGIFEVVTEARTTLQGTAVIVATGATPLRLDIPDAHHLVRHGLGTSIRTHGHLVAGKLVAVIGATDRAIRGPAELARMAVQVYLIAPSLESTALPIALGLQHQPNVSIFAGYEVPQVIVSVSIAGLRAARNEEKRLLEVDQAFVDLGLIPNSDPVRSIAAVDTRGFIIVDRHNATQTPGVFAAGDVTSAPGEQVLVIVGAGPQAAVSAYDYLLARQLMPQISCEAAYPSPPTIDLLPATTPA